MSDELDQHVRDCRTIEEATGKWQPWMTFEGGTRQDRREEAERQRRIREEALRIRADREHRAFLAGDTEAGVYGDYPPAPLP